MSIEAQLISAADYVQGITESKASCKAAIEAKGVTVGNVALSEYASKIAEIISGGQTIEPTLQIPTNWHDPESLNNQYWSETYPHSICLLLSLAKSSIALSGGDRYITSDGIIYNNSTTHVFDPAQDGVGDNSGKVTRWVIIQSAISSPAISFTAANYGTSLLALVTREINIVNMLARDIRIPFMLIRSANTPVVLPANFTSGNLSLCGCVYIEKISGSTGTSAFANCSSLNSIFLPIGLTEIGTSSFINCVSLTQASIPVGVNIIKMQAFSGCSSLSLLNIPEGCTSIESNTFQNCTSLPEIIIPSTVIYIGVLAFGGCTSVVKITISSTNIAITNTAFQNCTNCTNLVLASNFDSTLDIRYLTGLTRDNVLANLIPQLKDNTSNPPKVVTFATAVYNRLTADDLALLVQKNWSISIA